MWRLVPIKANYFVNPLRLKNSINEMSNSGKLFADELNNWLIDEAGF